MTVSDLTREQLREASSPSEFLSLFNDQLATIRSSTELSEPGQRMHVARAYRDVRNRMNGFRLASGGAAGDKTFAVPLPDEISFAGGNEYQLSRIADAPVGDE